jgi:hypothetical protein
MPMPPPKTIQTVNNKTVNKVNLPIGTRIIFIKTLDSGPDEFSPGNLYAEKGDYGEVTGHGCPEVHWVKWDKWEASFGAKYGTEFIEATDIKKAKAQHSPITNQ